MTNADRDQELAVEKLLADLAHGPISLSSAPELAARRARLLPRLREQVKQLPATRLHDKRRRRLVAAAWTSSAAAAVIAAVGASRFLVTPEDAQLVLQPRGNTVELIDQGEYRAVSESVSISASGRLETREDAALTTADGVLVELAGNTSVGLDQLNQRSGWRLQLRRGHVACEVPKLGEHKTFSVVTNDAEVIVHGTRFSVTSDATATCVRVAEGRVEVRTDTSATFLTPGQHWGCDAPDADRAVTSQSSPPTPTGAAASEQQTLEAVSVDKAGQGRRSTGKSRSVATAATSSTLALETDLVGRALAAERRGEFTSAKALYALFLARYPSSPMAPEARRGLQRVSVLR